MKLPLLVRPHHFALFLGLAVAAASPCAAEPGVTVFTGARLIDGTGKPPLEEATLIVKGDRIVAVGTAAALSAAVPAGATIIDEKGMTIIPGLISAHSHLGLVKGASTASAGNYTRENVAAQLGRYEGEGVTAVLSLGVNQDVLYQWRDEQRAGKLPGADIFTADRGLGVGGGAPPFPLPSDQIYRPKDADEARAAVREMAGRHPDLIKLWLDDIFGTMPKMAPDIFRAAIDEAHHQGLRVAAHLFYLADAKALVGAGVDVLAHSVRDKPVDEELISAMKSRHVMYIPTLALDESQFVYAEHPAWMDEPIFTSAVDPALLATWLSPDYGAKIAGSQSTARNRRAFDMAMRNVKTLHDAGIPIALGTDSGAMPTRIAGFSEHRELQLLVRAGLKPAEALVCGTLHSAEVIGRVDERGTLEAGKRADFVVLAGNPLDDIRNTTRLSLIWHGGVSIVPLTQRQGTPAPIP